MRLFADKVALVTGGTSGIGRATALAFAREGAQVLVTGRRMTEGDETVRLIQQAGGRASFIPADMRSEQDVIRLLAQIEQSFTRLDFAFNNAGTGAEGQALTEQTEETFDNMMATNVKGVWLCLKHELKLMLRQQAGVIVNTTSVGDCVGFPGAVTYTASKHAVLGLTRASALEYAKHGIRVNAVSPGTIETDMFRGFVGDDHTMRDAITAMHPVGRIGDPEDVAEAVIFLCSDRAKFITGHSLKVDGGFVAA